MQLETEAGAVEAAPALPDDSLVVRRLFKHYGAVHAVDDVSLECLPGEVLALVGENGAGKSTVAKILAGALRPTSGTIELSGAVVDSSSVHESRRAGIACAFQELALVPDWTVAENLSLPDGRALRPFSHRVAIATTRATLEEFELDHIDPSVPVATLSLADRQMVEIVRAIAVRPRILILDEASSALGPPGVEWLFRRIHELTALGASVIYVSHRLREIARIADRGTVLRDGKVVGQFTRDNWTDNELVSLMAGREASRHFPKRPALAHTSLPPALAVTNLVADGLSGVTLSIARGEILGIGGLQGHGQAELLRALYGAVPASSDSWSMGGAAIKRLNPVRAVRLGAGYVPEDRKREGLALQMGVGENLLAPWLRPVGLGGTPLLRQERTWIQSVFDALSVRTRGALENAGALSGGNQQKLVFGRWIGRDRKLVLLHDPTRGIDVRAKQELYSAITMLSELGVGVLWFSTEVEELVHLCHRVVVLYRGAVAEELSGKKLTADAIVGAAVGVKGKQ